MPNAPRETTRRPDIDYTATHRHPNGTGSTVVPTILVCTECGVGNYAAARPERDDLGAYQCTICGHGVHPADFYPNLDPGESLGTVNAYGLTVLTVDVYVDRDSIDSRDPRYHVDPSTRPLPDDLTMARRAGLERY